MEFEQGYRFGPHTAGIGYQLQEYQHAGRDTAFTIENGVRFNRRVCPVRAPVNGARLHIRGDENETGQSRRRVAVACARCRKRKIRCSGDPGDGSGCQNCTSAGIEPKNCQFHRVGSGEATSMIDLHKLNQFANSQQAMMQVYSDPTSSGRPRPVTYPSGLDTRSILPPHWYSSPFNSEDTSPVENYGLEHSAAYLPTQSSVLYSGGYGWDTDNKPAIPGYMSQDPGMYRTNGLHNTHHSIRTVASSDALSHSMTTLQLTMPKRPRTRAGLPASQRPQLPIPQPSPAQTTRNVVDQLQDQRLRSAQVMGGSSATSSNNNFGKPLLPFHNDIDAQATTTTDSLPTQTTSSTSSSAVDTAPCYSTFTSSSTEALPVTSSTPFDFHTTPLFEAMPAPTQPTYSNLRDSQDCKPTSSPTKNAAPMTQQMSHDNFYSIRGASNPKAMSDAGDSLLVSGHRYTPLSQSRSQANHQAIIKSGSGNTSLLVHRNSTATLNQSF